MLTIRPSFDQNGVLYSVQNTDTKEVVVFRPGGTLPFVSGQPIRATTAARPLRAWVLDGDVTIETSSGMPQVEGHKGDYLLELEHGDLFIVKMEQVRDGFDLAGDISRVYRNNTQDVKITFEDVAKIYDKLGRELQ